MKKLLAALVLATLLGGCAAVATKVEGDFLVNNRLAVKVTDAWNKIATPGVTQPYETWTQEGLNLDHLRLWAGIQPGQAMLTLPANATRAGQKAPRIPTFAKGMQPDQLVNMFETMYSNDGSLVTVTRVEPASFGGEPGLKFEFGIVRKRDDLQFRGVGWVSVRKDELFAATFVAPKLTFYPRILPKAEAVVRSARIKG